MSRWVWVLMLTAACAHAPQQTEQPEGKAVFVGARGVRAEVVHLPGNRCLLHVTGTGSVLDGHVFGCEREEDTGIIRPGLRYVIKLDGEPSHPLQVDSSRTMLYPPGTNAEHPLQRDPGESERLDPRPLREKHDAERDVLAKLARFDRPAREASEKEHLAESLRWAREKCGFPLEASVDWSVETDERLMGDSTAERCQIVLDEVAGVCSSAAARARLSELVNSVRCRAHEGSNSFSAEGTTLVASLGASVPLGSVEGFLLDLGQTPGIPREPPWGDGRSVGQQLVIGGTRACSDQRGHLVALTPESRLDLQALLPARLYTGDRDSIFPVPPAEALAAQLFVDGRQSTTEAFDARLLAAAPVSGKFLSAVVFHDDARECVVRCGDRKVRLPMLSSEETAKALLTRKTLPPPFTRRPHALLRDPAGAYYFVDTSTLPDRQKDFRVFVGPRGSMRQLSMTNALSDSEGELFSTRSGDLKLSLDRTAPSFWLAGKKKVELKTVPIGQNLDVIFLELGVYTGQRLGTPCDDF